MSRPAAQLCGQNSAPANASSQQKKLYVGLFPNHAHSHTNGTVRGCSGPREDATRIGSAGVIRRQAVDISPLRRVNSALYLISTGAREASFRNIKTIAECLADELINAAKGSSNR